MLTLKIGTAQGAQSGSTVSTGHGCSQPCSAQGCTQESALTAGLRLTLSLPWFPANPGPSWLKLSDPLLCQDEGRATLTSFSWGPTGSACAQPFAFGGINGHLHQAEKGEDKPGFGDTKARVLQPTCTPQAPWWKSYCSVPPLHSAREHPGILSPWHRFSLLRATDPPGQQRAGDASSRFINTPKPFYFTPLWLLRNFVFSKTGVSLPAFSFFFFLWYI